MTTVKTIAGYFDEQKYQKLKKAYEEAVAKDQESFDWGGEPLLTRFAHYLLEFLAATFEPGVPPKGKT